MASAAPKRMTLAEFLTWDDGTKTRYELVRGDLVAMAPVRARHSRIVGNLAGVLRPHLKPPCGVYTEAGIVPADRDDTYYEADLAISCASLEADPGWVPDPVLIVEVVSPSAAVHDRSTQVADHRRHLPKAAWTARHKPSAAMRRWSPDQLAPATRINVPLEKGGISVHMCRRCHPERTSASSVVWAIVIEDRLRNHPLHSVDAYIFQRGLHGTSTAGAKNGVEEPQSTSYRS